VIHDLEGWNLHSTDCFGRSVVGCLLRESLEWLNVQGRSIVHMISFHGSCYSN
jgi:hypothetical protein